MSNNQSVRNEKYQTEAKLCCPRCEGNGYILVKSTELRLKKSYSSNRVRTLKLRNDIRNIGEEKIKTMSLRKAGALVGIKSAQQMKHHLTQVEAIGWKNYE